MVTYILGNWPVYITQGVTSGAGYVTIPEQLILPFLFILGRRSWCMFCVFVAFVYFCKKWLCNVVLWILFLLQIGISSDLLVSLVTNLYTKIVLQTNELFTQNHICFVCFIKLCQVKFLIKLIQINHEYCLPLLFKKTSNG